MIDSSSTAQKADFMALAHILGITLSAKHFAKPDDRACSLDEIANAVIFKYDGTVDPTKLPTPEQVAKVKQTLKGSKQLKQLASNLAPALITPVVPAGMLPVTVRIGTPGSEDSQQESAAAMEAPVFNSQ